MPALYIGVAIGIALGHIIHLLGREIERIQRETVKKAIDEELSRRKK